MGKVSTHGRMEDVMKGNIRMTRNTDKVHTSGRTEESISETGIMVNNTEKDATYYLPD
jgi:hypothetical protein